MRKKFTGKEARLDARVSQAKLFLLKPLSIAVKFHENAVDIIEW